jgi:hypothetical protein
MQCKDEGAEAQPSQAAQVGMLALRGGAHAITEAATAKERCRGMNKPRTIDFKPGDEVSYAMPSGVLYGTISRVLGAGDAAAIEIEFEDGRKEVKKVKDRALSLLKRASGRSEEEERHRDRDRLRDPDIQRVFRSEQKKRW